MIENEGSLVNRVMKGQVAGKRPRGRPRKRWRDEFLGLCRFILISLYSRWTMNV